MSNSGGESDQSQPIKEEAPAGSGIEPEITATSAHQESGTNGPGDSGQSDKSPTRRFLFRLSVNEWLTFLLGVGTLVLSFLTYRVASDNSDIKSAVSNLGTLAKQTARQAKALEDQFAQVKQQTADIGLEAQSLKRQADTQAGQLTEAQRQTKAISEQTRAIKQTSSAEIRSATAQEKSANTTAMAHKPALTVSKIEINGLNTPPDKDGMVLGSFRVYFRNIGGSAVNNPVGPIALLFSKILPAKPDYSKFTSPIGGNDLSVLPGTEFQTVENAPFITPKALADDVANNRVSVFVYGSITYSDVEGGAHLYCFGYVVPMKGTNPSGYYFQIAHPAYHCDK